MDGIRVPVSLEVVQSSIANIKAAISNLKPDSKAWKELQGILRSMEREADRLQITMSKPFNTQTQFNQAEKSIEKMDEALSKASITMSRLNFSDIKLTPEQQATFNNLKQELVDIQNSIKQFKTNAKAELQSDPIAWDSIVKVDPNAATRTFDELLKVIRKNNAKIQEEYQKAQEIATAAQNQNKLAEATEKAFSKANPLQEALGSDFSKFFELKKGSTTDYKFKTGQRNEFLQWVQDNFTLTDEQIAEIKRTSGTKMAQLFQDIKAEAVAHAQSIKTTNTEKQKHADELAAQAANAARAANAMGEQVDKVSAASAKYDQSIQNNTAETERFMAAVTNTARSSDTFINADRQMQSQLENLRTTLATTNAEFLRMQRVQQSFNQMKMAIVNFMGFSQVLNLTKRAVREAINHIKELDSVMNKISIVTDMSTEDLWQQVDQYSKMAQNYGTTIKGAYEVSQIYYQQGLETNDVLTLTNETLKLAKVSGLDYAQTTDYMTTALRGFKMEMSEASTVVDVYSNLAAHTAVSQEELAVAMSKTASSMESVGSTFEESSAMIGTMVAVTRESATNIGSALKSIASRYGEMKSDPSILQDAEGEAIAYNKVDAALQSVGITLKTTDGQFRSFTDVILELSEVWDQLESTQQRYIATQFAGNRQQSRFLALVSNPELLKANIAYAEESEDTGTLQALKALDSIESKLNQVQVAYQQFYTTMGVENVWKGLLDGATNVINTLNSFPKLFGKIPIGAIAAVGNIVGIFKSLGIKIITEIAQIFGKGLSQGFNQSQSQAAAGANGIIDRIVTTLKGGVRKVSEASQQVTQAATPKLTPNQLTDTAKAQYTNNQKVIDYFNKYSNFSVIGADREDAYATLAYNMQRAKLLSADVWASIKKDPQGAEHGLISYINALNKEQEALLKVGNNAQNSSGKLKQFTQNHSSWSQGLQTFGSALNMAAMLIDTSKPGMKTLSGSLMSISGAATLAGVAVQVLNNGLNNIPWMAVITGMFALINGISTLIISPEERIKELEERAEELNNKAKEAKANYRTLDNSIKKLDELKEKRYESAEAAEEYQTAVDELADKFPAMIAGFDEAGNVILDTTNAEEVLAEARRKSAQATYEAAKGEMDEVQAKKEESRRKLRENGIKQDISFYNSDIQARRRAFIASDEIGGGAGAEDFYDAATALKLTVEAWSKGHTITSDDTTLQDYALAASRGFEYNEETDEFTFLNGEISLENLKAYYDKLLELGYTLESSELEIYNLFLAGTDISIEKAKTTFNKAKQNFNSIITKDTSSLEEIENAYTELEKAYSLVRSTGLVNEDDLAELSKQMSAAYEAIEDYGTIVTGYKGKEKSFASAWQHQNLSVEDGYSYLEESSAGIAIVSQLISDNIPDNYKGTWTALEQKQRVLWVEYGNAMQRIIDTLSPDELDLFNKMYNDQSKTYSAEDIIKQFNLSGIIATGLKNLYSTGLNSLQERIEKNFEQANINIDDWELSQVDTSLEESLLSNILSQYSYYINKGLENTATGYLNAGKDLFDAVEGISDISLRGQILDLIKQGVLSTREGILAISSKMSSLGDNVDIKTIQDYLEKLAKTTISNIPLTIQTLLNDYLDNWKEASSSFGKAISGGIEGYEIQNLIDQAAAVGITIDTDNFSRVGTKFILDQKLWNDWYDASNDALDVQIESLNETISQLKSVTYDTITKDNLEQLGITVEEGTIPQDYYEDFITALDEQETELARLIFYRYIAEAELLTDQLKTGNYKSISSNLKQGLKAWDRLLELASGEEYTDKELSDKNIKDTVEGIQSSYSKFLSDLISKGYENIDWTEYEYITKEHLDLGNIDLIDYINKFSKFAKLTTDEINNLILQAYEKQQERFSEDLIKDFTFTDKSTFKATRESLTKLANAYDKNIEELINSSKLAFDETTQEYTIGVEQLKDFGIDLSKVHNFEITVQESIDSLFSGLISDVQNALSGKLDIKGLANLKETLSALGIDVALDFVETSDGLQLTNDGLYDLYASIRKINQIGAKKLLPDMKQMSKSYGDLSSVMKEYKEAVSDVSKANEAQLLSDLIQDYLSNPDSFKFDQGYTNVQDEIAKNAYQGAFNTYKNWAEASKTNTIEADKFTSTLAQLAAYAPDKIIGTTGKTAQQLYDERFGYMTTDKNGNPIYDLESMGLTGKNITALMDAFEEYTNYVVEQSNIQQRAYMDLTYAQRELNKEGVLPKEGKLSLERIKELAGAGTALETVFKNIHFEDGTLYDRIFGENGVANVELANQFIRILSNTNLSLEEMQQQVSAMLGDEFVVSLDEKGQFKIDLANPILSVGGKELKGSAASEWQKAVSLAYEENINTDTGTITYTLDGQNVTLQVQEDGSVEYSLTLVGGDYAGAVITAGTEAELKRNLAAFGYLSSGTVDAVASKDSTITISGVTYTIKYDANGKVIVETPEGQENVDTEKVRTELQDKLRSEMEKESIPVDGKIKGEVSALELLLAEGASVELAAENVTLTKDVAKAEGNVTNLKLTYAGESTEQSIDTQGRIITGYVSEEYLDTKNEVKTIDLSYLGLGIVTLDTQGKKIKGVVDPANTEGTGTVPAGQCKLTINGTTVTIEDSAGNKYTGTLPDSVGENTTFSNTGFINAEKATLKISGGKITITTADGQTYTATIPQTILDTLNPTGSVSVDNCHVYSSGNQLYVEAPTGQTFVLGFKDGSLPGATGTVQASNCSIDVDSDTLTVSGTDADGNSKTYTVEFEEGTLEGSGELKSGACSVEIKEDGTWTITNKDGVSVPIPANKIKGSGDLTTAELIAKLAEDSYTLNGTIPEFDLGEVSAFATFNNVELRVEDPYANIRAQLAGLGEKWTNEGMMFKNTNGFKFNTDEVKQYIQAMEEAARNGQILDKIDFDNLRKLSKEGAVEDAFKQLAAAAVAASESNAEKLQRQVELLNGLNLDNLNNLSQAVALIQNLTSALLLLQTIQWKTITDGLNSLGADTNLDTKEPFNVNVELGVTDEAAQTAVDEFNNKLASLMKRSPYNIRINQIGANTATTAIQQLAEAIESLKSQTITITAEVGETAEAAGNVQATGNVALAGGRKTLMGELGPELYVTNGHYYVAGQNGAEFVNLPKDAIVFNHLQTRRLLNGRNGVNGRPVTNERVAVGEAHAFSANKSFKAATVKSMPVDPLVELFNKVKNSSIVNTIKNSPVVTTITNTIKTIKDTATSIYKAGKETISKLLTVESKEEEAIDTLAAASQNQASAAKSLEQTSSDLVETTSKSFTYDQTRLHSGYRRAGGYTGDTTASTSTSNGRYKLKKKGPGDTSLSGWDSDRIRALATGNIGSGEDPQKKLQETQKLIGTVISNLLSQGFEAIDLSSSDYANLDEDLKKEMQAYINREDASYREFVASYGEAANLTIKEFNEKYFEAWQRDAYLVGDSEEVLTAVEGLTFFRGGKVAGSAEDWTTIFGDFTDVAELVDAGLIEWDTQLRQYIVTDIEALKQFDTNLDSIEDLVAMRNDDILENFKDIQDKFSSAIEGTLSNMDALGFKKQLELNGIDIDDLEFTKTAQGLKISTQSAIKLYDTLSKIDGLQANVAFDALKENLEANDVHYRDMATINEHILDLTNEIAKLNATSDDTKLKQYQAELKVATEIRDMRIASQDDYYSQMGKSLEGGMNNPLDLIKDIVQINTALAKGNVGGNDLYNLLTRANNTAKTGGKAINLGDITLTGTEESLTEAWRKAISSGGLKLDENGESTFDLNALGIDLDDVKENTAQFIEGWNVEKKKAIEALNNNIPKAAIQEALKSIDIEGFGADDLIKDNAYTDTFKDAASKLIVKAAKDTRLLESLKGRTVGEHTLYDILTDAANGKEAVETAEDLSEALQEITNYQGDSTDLLERQKAVWENLPLDSITDQLEEMLEATTAFVGEIERWYNYLQKIATLEQYINYEEKLRSTIKNGYNDKDGYAYVESQLRSLQDLQLKYKTNEEQLPKYIEAFQTDAQRAVEAGWGSVIKYDETTGAIQYRDLEQMMKIFNVDTITGEPNTIQALDQEAQLIKILGQSNYEALTKYTASGQLITSTGKSEQEAAAERVQALFEKSNDQLDLLIQDDKNIYDVQADQLDIVNAQSDIFNEIRDNQISLENEILKAIVDIREREIKEQEKTRDALKDTFDNLINGLKDQLSRERKMAENQKDANELAKLQRQLAILQRSGGSATQIASLQSQIADKQQENYFNTQELEIEKIEEAQNNQIEKLDAQIDLMKETLEYQKQFGLLWTDVKAIMQKNPKDITDFITKENSDYWNKSSTELDVLKQNTSFSIERQKAYADLLNNANAGLSNTLLSDDNIGKTFKALAGEYNDEFNALKTNIPTVNDYSDGVKSINENVALIKENFNKSADEAIQGLQDATATDTSDKAADTSGKTEDTSGKTEDTSNPPADTSGKTDEKTPTKYNVGWNKDDTGWWYADEEDHYLANQWLKYKDDWYYFDEKGYMVHSTTRNIEGKTHKFDDEGIWRGEIEKVEAAVSEAEVEKVEAAEASTTETTSTPTLEYREYVSDGASGHHSVFHYSNGVTENGAVTDHTPNASGECIYCGYIQRNAGGGGGGSVLELAHNASGGLVKRPTLSWLAEKGEEAVFNAEQTKILKNDILGSSKNSLLNLLQDFRAAYAGNSYSSINNGASVVIEHAEVNMKVDKLADSYDAAQAGQDVMREILNIARKTSAQNRVGR